MYDISGYECIVKGYIQPCWDKDMNAWYGSMYVFYVSMKYV